MKTFFHDPDDTTPFGVNWGPFLASIGNETVVSVEWLVPSGVSVDNKGLNAAKVHVGYLTGGQLGKTYAITSRLTTQSGIRQDHTVSFLVREG